jgi:hypothetical protein
VGWIIWVLIIDTDICTSLSILIKSKIRPWAIEDFHPMLISSGSEFLKTSLLQSVVHLNLGGG